MTTKEDKMEYSDMPGRIRDAGYQTKDSGVREEFDSGMVRDTEKGKARFDLLLPHGVPYRYQMLTRFAELMARGADKYGDRNWELARGEEELKRYRSSALRHLMQWISGEGDEDHAAAVMFNVLAGETVTYKMQHDRVEAEVERLKQIYGIGGLIPKDEFLRRAGVDDPEMC